MDSLIIWLEHYQYIKNKSGMILTCKELGKRYRERLPILIRRLIIIAKD